MQSFALNQFQIYINNSSFTLNFILLSSYKNFCWR